MMIARREVRTILNHGKSTPPLAGAKGGARRPIIVAFRSAKGAFPGRPFAGAKGDDETASRVRAVGRVPPIVAFRSAKGAFPLRPFAGAKGDDETASRRGRRPRSSPWRQRAAHRCLSLREKGHFRQAAQALAAQSPVMILARSHGGLAWVIGNVLPQVFILTRTPHKVVERLLLPDLSFFVDRLIDAKGRVMEP